ncbi:MAG: hypothetical protein HWE34_04330 [Methylocystaceae bacterium]|nr:hypothetical protein [Methylocystaceae bacterium]
MKKFAWVIYGAAAIVFGFFFGTNWDGANKKFNLEIRLGDFFTLLGAFIAVCGAYWAADYSARLKRAEEQRRLQKELELFAVEFDGWLAEVRVQSVNFQSIILKESSPQDIQHIKLRFADVAFTHNNQLLYDYNAEIIEDVVYLIRLINRFNAVMQEQGTEKIFYKRDNILASLTKIYATAQKITEINAGYVR